MVDDISSMPIPHYRLSPVWLRSHRVHGALNGVTHLINESNFPFMMDPRKARFVDEISSLSRRGIKLGVVFHGSDARDPQTSLELNPHSYFRDASPEWIKQLASNARRNRESVLQAGLETFVTTPDMLVHVPQSNFLPISLEVDYWSAIPEAFRGRLPRVLHRPAGDFSPIKGTRYIIPVLEDFERRGLIEIVRSPVVSHAGMKHLLSSADIVVDQIQTGAYGVTAIEAMAAGRLVIANVSVQAREALGGAVPVVEANPSSLATALESIIGDVNNARIIAESGKEFVRRWHDGKAASQTIEKFLNSK